MICTAICKLTKLICYVYAANCDLRTTKTNFLYVRYCGLRVAICQNWFPGTILWAASMRTSSMIFGVSADPFSGRACENKFSSPIPWWLGGLGVWGQGGAAGNELSLIRGPDLPRSFQILNIDLGSPGPPGASRISLGPYKSMIWAIRKITKKSIPQISHVWRQFS